MFYVFFQKLSNILFLNKHKRFNCMNEDYNILSYNEEKLKYLSKLLNLKTKDIAKKLGVQDSFISKLYDYRSGK